jgi:hypothetical protein
MASNSTDRAAPLPVSAGIVPVSCKSMRIIDGRLDHVVSEYLAAWNAVDDVRRRRHLQATWNECGTFEDPLVHLEGRGAMNAYIAACRAAQPDVRWSVVSDIAHHHGHILFAWTARDCHGRELFVGNSFGELDEQGQIRRLVGFFASVAPADGPRV